MRRIVVICIMLLGMWQAVWAADFSHLIILHTNDTHGYDRRGEDGSVGMAAVAAAKKAYEAQGYDVLYVDAGDAIQDNNLVNFSQGKTAIAFMNAAGYDAMTLGNHEFDYGQDVTLQRVQEAHFPVISCNIMVDATGKSFVPAHAVIQKGDVKIGLIGMTTPDTQTAVKPLYVQGLTFLGGEALYAKVRLEAAYLRQAGCDLIVALGHLGSDGDGNSRSDDVLQHVQGIDLFIDGHDHRVKQYAVGGTLLAETGCHLQHIGALSWHNGQWTERLLSADNTLAEDQAVKTLVDTAAAAVQQTLDNRVGTSAVWLNGTRSPGVRTEETNLGDFIADAIYWQTKMAAAGSGKSVDGAIVNGGGLRASLSGGAVTAGDIYRVLPYRNQLYIMEISGKTLLEILEAATYLTPQPAGAFPQVAGMKLAVKTDVSYIKGRPYNGSSYYAPAVPGRRVTIYEVGGRPFSPDATYRIGTYDFICYGGDAYGALAEPGRAVLFPAGYTDADAVFHYLQDELHGYIDETYGQPAGRIILH